MSSPFTYTQATPSALWTIYHPFQHLPRVTLAVGVEEVMADIRYPGYPKSSSPVVIGFQDPQTGTAILV
jgi:hypothetical protein